MYKYTQKGADIDRLTKGSVSVQFGIGFTDFIGSIYIQTLAGRVKFYIVNVDTPFLLCLADINRLKLYYNNVKDMLISTIKKYPVIRQFGYAFWLWQNQLYIYIIDGFNSNFSYLTKPKLRGLYYRFSYLSVNKLYNLLK